MNKINIKQIVKSPCWPDVKQVFVDEIKESKKVINFKCEGKTDALIASECRAREQAVIILDKVFKKLDRIASERDIEKESFK
jgi:hypothetical protein